MELDLLAYSVRVDRVLFLSHRIRLSNKFELIPPACMYYIGAQQHDSRPGLSMWTLLLFACTFRDFGYSVLFMGIA